MSDNLVPEPQASVFDSVSKVLGDEEAARRVMANPQLAAGFPEWLLCPKSDGGVEMCACGRHPKSGARMASTAARMTFRSRPSTISAPPPTM